MGYHVNKIKKGKLGEISKIQEELDELKDAHEQGVRILELCELADMMGAIQAFLLKYYPNVQLTDLEDMAVLTARAFRDGSRK